MSRIPSAFLGIVTVLFTAFILTVIWLADTGRLQGVLQFVHAIPYGDKVGHFLLMGMLCFLASETAVRVFPHKQPRRVVALVCLVLAVVFGVEEASQSLIRVRNASFFDLLADWAGIAAFGWLSLRFDHLHEPPGI